MNLKPTLSSRVRQLIADTFGMEESELPANVSQATVAGWTPATHSVLVSVLECSFSVSFSMSDVLKMTSLPVVCDALRRHLPVQPV